MTAWQQSELDELESVFHSSTKAELLARFPGKTVGQVRGKAINLQLSARASGTANSLKEDHPAVQGARTRYPGKVRQPGAAVRLLVPGRDQRKLGGRVKRPGAWFGWPIYSLTLEERATCPSECHHWLTCYGNSMQWSVRIDASDPVFLPELEIELEDLQAKHPDGFVVRLHVLGDFYSVEYVEQWERWLDEFPALHVFGYTARDPQQKSDIGAKVLGLAFRRWDRFAVRLSSVTPGPGRAVTIFDPDPPPVAGVITCPAELFHPDGTRKTKGCNTCGLCWRQAARAKTIQFIAHGGARKGKSQ